MNRSNLHEVLAALYLRLNGYFTTGLVLHSEKWGHTRTEIDCLAIRHPQHEQPGRRVQLSEFMNAGEEEIDLILCEVKSCPEQLCFNKALRTDLEALHDTLQWAGVFTERQVNSVAARLQPLLQDGVTAEEARTGVLEGLCRVRPLLCCPPSAEGSVGGWCLVGSEIISFVDRCLNPPARRDSCSTTYSLRVWGYPFEPMVTYFKDKQRLGPPTLDGLYKSLGA
jgi:hypothetical protein